MDSSKFVIVGAKGQLGKALTAQYPNAHALGRDDLDISDKKSVDSFDWSEVTHIFNGAAYTDVDGAETIEGRIAAWQINGVGVANLVSVAQKHNITLIHVSTEFVFDGSIEIHGEDEVYSPISSYSSSKAAGDIVASTPEKHYIVRSSWVIGDGKNFVRTMMGLADKNISPAVINDHYGRLTFATELVRAIDHLLTKECNYGIYNVSNEGERATWADITREIFLILGREDLSVKNITNAEYYSDKPGSAIRPLQSMLDLTKIHSTGFISRDWKDDLLHYIKGENS